MASQPRKDGLDKKRSLAQLEEQNIFFETVG